jgi:uncharacterized membrane protein YqjE
MAQHEPKGNGESWGGVTLHEAKRLTTTELLGLIAGRAALLAEKQVELAKAEIQANIRAEIRMVIGLAIAAVCAIVAISLLLVAAVFGLSDNMPGWAAALILAGVMLLLGGIAGLVGWRMRVTAPLSTTRQTLKENLYWAKERLTGGAS